MPRSSRDPAAVRDQLHFFFSPGATMTVGRAAKLLGVCPETIRVMIRRDEIKGFKLRDLPGSPYRVLRASVEQYIRRIGDEYNLE